MLVIRMQRKGRKGLAQYRVIVQDSRRTPTSGRIVANLGHFDPRTKDNSVDIKLAEKYLSNGAQPSSRVAKFLKANGVKLPEWVKLDESKSAKIKNADKLRSNQPAAEEEAPADAPDVEPEASSEAEQAKPEQPEETDKAPEEAK